MSNVLVRSESTKVVWVWTYVPPESGVVIEEPEVPGYGETGQESLLESSVLWL